MAKQDLGTKTVKELREMAKRRGLTGTAGWKKKDFVKALSPKKKSASARKAKSAATLPAESSTGKRSTKSRAVAKTKKAHRKVPAQKKSSQAEIKLPALPAEFREEEMVSMPVSPSRVYVYWEIPEDKMARYEGSLNLKISDIKTKSFFYTPISGRIGESFINVNPDSDFTIELGIIDKQGKFVDIISRDSGKPEIPRAAEEIPPGRRTGKAKRSRVNGLPEEFFEIPDSVGSSS